MGEDGAPEVGTGGGVCRCNDSGADVSIGGGGEGGRGDVEGEAGGEITEIGVVKKGNGERRFSVEEAGEGGSGSGGFWEGESEETGKQRTRPVSLSKK